MFGRSKRRDISLVRRFAVIWLLLCLGGVSFDSEVTARQNNRLSLTDEELQYIDMHREVSVGVDPFFSPYEFIDTDGQYKGIVADYVELIEERTGLVFQVVEGLSWDEAYEMAIQGDIDVLPCVGVTSQRADFFLFSDVYMTYQRVILSRTDAPRYDRNDLQDVVVGTQKNSSHSSFLSTEANVEATLFTTQDELLLALSYGDIDSAVTNYASSSYRLKMLGISNIKVDYVFDDHINEFAFGVTNDNQMLQSIINKALASITEEEKVLIRNNWLGIEKKIDYTRIILGVAFVIIAAGLLVGIFIYWNHTLKIEIRRRKETESELIEARLSADEANQAKSRFLAHMSHEIRTPLNAISGHTYLLENTETSSVQNRYIHGIKSASYNLLSTINDILDFSKIEAGEVDVEAVPMNVDKILDKVSAILAVKASEKNIGFHVKRDMNIPNELVGDPTKVEQILLNFANNAIKFTRTGRVSIEVSLVRCYEHRCEVLFAVTDTGMGIEGDQLDNLFIPFHQLDASITRKYGGTGLGLTICKKLADTLGGTIDVQSTLGVGSRFCVQLPFVVVDEKMERRHPDFAGMRALVVDSDLINRDIIMDYIESYQFKVEVAPVNNTVVSKGVSPKSYDLIICEIDLIEGKWMEQLTEAINRGVSVIGMSKDVQEVKHREIERMGVHHILMKPVIPSLLFDSIVQSLCGETIETSVMTPETKSRVSGKILLVEDNPVNQMIEKEILLQQGYEVIVANHGGEAVKAIELNQDIDIVLMDIHMPEMDGFEATVKIREAGSNVPIIAMTAVAVEEMSQQAMDVGMDGYVTKPVDPRVLFNELEKMMFSNNNQRNNEDENELVKPPMTLDLQQINTDGMIDLKQGLARIGGNIKLYEEVLIQFKEDMKTCNMLMTKYMRNQDYDQAYKLVHKVKGCSGNIAATNLFRSSTTLMNAVNDGIEIDYGPYLWEFERDMDNTLIAIEQVSLKIRQYRENNQQGAYSPAQINAGETNQGHLESLATMLEQADLDAFKLFERIEQQYDVTVDPWKTIKSSMGKYDFKTALDHLQNHIDQKGGEVPTT